MNRFAGVLKEVNRTLDLPQPTRSRILLEMAGDLEDLYRHHLSEGLDEAEAARRAEEAFVASEEALRRLARIHEKGGDWADRLTRQLRTLWEKALLVLWLVAVILLVGKAATEERLFLVRSPFVWPLMILAVAVLALGVWKLYQLFVKKRLDVRRLRSGLSGLLFLAAASLMVSACGFLYHLRWYAFQTFEGAPETVFRMFGTWTLAISSMAIIGLLTAVLAAMVWFVLANLIAGIENREADALLAN
ncbi:MAG: hypothetical protein OES47_05735 [Acidobacteriota bacterium]|nr:hypothetical protein [Acidobacteriota bacterium]